MDGVDPNDLVFGEGPDQERLRAVFDYWNGKRRGREMPSRADLDPADLKPFLAQLALLDVENEPLRFRYRLVGTEVTRIRRGTTKSDPTGQYVDEVTHHQGTSAVVAHYRRVVVERKPTVDSGTYTRSPDHPWLRFTRLVLPLSADGASINMLLVMLVPA